MKMLVNAVAACSVLTVAASTASADHRFERVLKNALAAHVRHNAYRDRDTFRHGDLHRHDDVYRYHDRHADYDRFAPARRGLQFNRGGFSFSVNLGSPYTSSLYRRPIVRTPRFISVVPDHVPPVPSIPPAVPSLPAVPAPPVAPHIPTPLPPARVHEFGTIVNCAVPLFDCVRVKDPDHVAPYAKPVIVAVRDPRVPRGCKHDIVPCVYVEVCVPPCPLERVKVSRDGTEVELDFGRYEIDLISCDGEVVIDYDD